MRNWFSPRASLNTTPTGEIPPACFQGFTEMRIVILFVVIGVLVYTGLAGLNRSNPITAEQKQPDLTAIFNGNYQQLIDQFGTVSRMAFDASGRRIGTQFGTYRPGAQNGMLVEMTYLEPDAEHPRGQAFDGAGNPMPVNTGPRA